MAFKSPPRVLETTTSTGTGNLALAGAVIGYSAFSARLANGDTFPYFVEAVDANGTPTGDWEEGLSTYNSTGNTISRTTVYRSSNADAAVNFAAGTKYVGVTRASMGTLVVLAAGGTPGTDEIELAYASNAASIRNPSSSGSNKFKLGGLEFQFTDRLFGSCYVRFGSGFFQTNNGYFAVANGDPSGTACDISLYRAAAKVFGIGSGSGSGSGTLRSIPLSPAQITADQSAYNPGVARNYFLTSNGVYNIHSLVISQVDGQECRFFNQNGTFNLTFKNNSVTGTAGSRFLNTTGADIVVGPDQGVGMVYDATSGITAWRVWTLF